MSGRKAGRNTGHYRIAKVGKGLATILKSWWVREGQNKQFFRFLQHFRWAQSTTVIMGLGTV